MRSESESAALVALLRAGRRPVGVWSQLLERAGGAIALLEEDHGLLAGPLLNTAIAEIAAWQREGIRLLTMLDPGYPENLRAVPDPPPLIFVAGQLEPGDVRSVAVIGSREPPTVAAARARAIASELVDCGYTVASGLAAGIDTAAHTAALARGGRTFAVIGTGLRRAYPVENAGLQRRIAAEGAVISQFWPDAPPSRRSFPMRNAVMSGLTLATVVVEATHTSGARTQARLAVGQGRPVVLVDSLLDQAWARDLAGRSGVHVAGSAAQVTEVIDRLDPAGALAA